MQRQDSNDRIQTVSADTFDESILRGVGPIVVEFMSYSCAHCRVLEPNIQRVAEMVGPEEKIFRVNIATDQELAGAYAIEGTPTLIMFLNGEVVGRDEGPGPSVSNILSVVRQPYGS
jgi:thioredoxin 1